METKTSGKRLYRINFINVEALLTTVLALWPLFHFIWVNLKVAQRFHGVNSSIFLICLIAILALLCNHKIKIKYLLIWIPFFLVIVTGIVMGRSLTMETARDLMAYAAMVVCYISIEGETDYKIIVVRILFLAGFFVSLTVLADLMFGLFRTKLIWIYTEGARSHKLSNSTTGGIIPSLGGAGCFILPGIAAYISLLRYRHRRIRVVESIVLIIFLITFIVIHKRSFALGSIAAVLIIWMFRRFFLYGSKPGKKTVNISKIISAVVTSLIFAGLLIVLYEEVPMIQEAVNLYISRFNTEDTTLSGRTQLYALAWRLFKSRPFMGVGWSKYRLYSYRLFSRYQDFTVDTHNVYLQLLAESGLMGLSTYLIPVVYLMIASLNHFRKSITGAFYQEQRCIFELGLFLEFFYLIYSMAGNPLYDYSFFAIYFLGLFLLK